MELIERLKKCGCRGIKYHCKPNDWYKIELFYDKRYYRFFALTFAELEIQSLREMRRINRRFHIKGGKQLWLKR